MQIADVVVARRLEIDIVNLIANRAIPPSGHALLEQLELDVNQHCDDVVALFGGELIQTLRLCGRARKAVEDVTVLAVVLRSALFDHLNCQLIGNQLSPFHDIANFLRERRVGVFERAKDISGGDLWQMQPFLKQARLRAFSGTRRTHQNYYFCHKGIRRGGRAGGYHYPGSLRNCASPAALRSARQCPSRRRRESVAKYRQNRSYSPCPSGSMRDPASC